MRLGDLQEGATFVLAGGSGSDWKVEENDGGEHVIVSSPGLEGRTWLAEMTVEPRIRATRIPGYVAIVSALPTCDLCDAEGRPIPNHARYDARTVLGPWANVCEEHFADNCIGGLGVGVGQYLVPSEEMEAGGLLPENVVVALQKVTA